MSKTRLSKMIKSEPETPVVFRVWKNPTPHDTDPFALFPTLPSSIDGFLCSSYAHVGQHSGADYFHYIRSSRPATPNEYKNLHDELVNVVGYKLKVVFRASQKMVEERKRLAKI